MFLWPTVYKEMGKKNMKIALQIENWKPINYCTWCLTNQLVTDADDAADWVSESSRSVDHFFQNTLYNKLHRGSLDLTNFTWLWLSLQFFSHFSSRYLSQATMASTSCQFLYFLMFLHSSTFLLLITITFKTINSFTLRARLIFNANHLSHHIISRSWKP